MQDVLHPFLSRQAEPTILTTSPADLACVQLHTLAAHLDAQRPTILEQWRVATEGVPGLSVASSLTRRQFNDHIPGVLETLGDTLRAWPNSPSLEVRREGQDHVAGHGLQRWQQGYQLRDVTREWGQLQTCLQNVLEHYAEAHLHLEPEVMPAARRTLAQLCWDGISDSVTQYWHLHQAEAAGHVSDLNKAIATLANLDRARAEAWREAAHDLRGSVTVVTGTSSILEQKDLAEPARAKFLDMLQRGVASLHDMLNDLMNLARLEAGQEQRQVAPFDAGALIGDFCASSVPLAERSGLYLRTEGPTTLLVEGDRTKVQRILQNLLLNALKYTREGGITVRWHAGQDQQRASWMFCVEDTGPGLDAGPGAPLAQQLYDATQTAHETDGTLEGMSGDGGGVAAAETVPAQSQPLPQHQRPGEGVGLSIVKRLCELLDASIELETSPGKGSTFRITLPTRYEHDAIDGEGDAEESAGVTRSPLERKGG